jgi:hypothetical protein
MATKLALMNQALGHLKEGKIASLAEAVEKRYVLDDYYDDAQKWCLEQGFWNHAMRVVQIDASDTLTPSFGFTAAFEKPSDWVKTYRMSADERFSVPLIGDQLSEEAGVWYGDMDPLYVQYVSSSVTYGLDLSLWPPTFQLFFTTHLAWLSCLRITSSTELWEKLEKQRDKLKLKAAALDAINQPPGQRPRGAWVTSRQVAPSRTRWP